MERKYDAPCKIYIAGHRGMVGSAIVRRLQSSGRYPHLVCRTSAELDLTRQSEVETFFDQQKPDIVILAAARVGGIEANRTYRADFITTNLLIQTHVIHSAWKAGVKQLIFLASSCIYPRLCPQPMKEDHLWSGTLEPTNSPYAVAKLSGIEMCRAYHDQHGAHFFSVIPTNLYGPNDNYDPQQSHVMAALLSKFHRAKTEGSPQVTLWGTGSPRRELLHVDDLADAVLFLMETYQSPEPVNIGYGEDIRIADLARLIADVTEYSGTIVFDSSKPDGTPRKLLDSSRLLSLGWKPGIPLDSGVRTTYQDYKKQLEQPTL